MVSDASPRADAASDFRSALMILARFSRSALAWRAIARFIASRGGMPLSSTSVTYPVLIEAAIKATSDKRILEITVPLTVPPPTGRQIEITATR